MSETSHLYLQMHFGRSTVRIYCLKCNQISMVNLLKMFVPTLVTFLFLFTKVLTIKCLEAMSILE